MAYRVIFRPNAEREVKRFSLDVQSRIMTEILALAETPRPSAAIKLKGSENLYRIRVGDYRVIYSVEDDLVVVVVVEVGNRKEIYRKPDKKLTRHSLREFIKKAIRQSD